uniref:Uncharacterized protein n=1 Tax=Candidatus Kentrum sp. DK TaxID=2126562 RepID=A0A450SAJ3_9GAMM|nr:MAG: hypothetical protein BECKDK2373C_GA0170839_102414 [Candidatus Kentron sp. DK]
MWIRYLDHPGRRNSGRRRRLVFKARSHLAFPQDSLVGWAKAPLGTFVVDAELSGAVPIMDTLMGTSLRSFAHPTSCKGGI